MYGSPCNGGGDEEKMRWPTVACRRGIKRVKYALVGPENANVAQLVEQLTRNEQVTGSSPVVGSRKIAPYRRKTAVLGRLSFVALVVNPRAPGRYDPSSGHLYHRRSFDRAHQSLLGAIGGARRRQLRAGREEMAVSNRRNAHPLRKGRGRMKNPERDSAAPPAETTRRVPTRLTNQRD